jgi:hypothetical protein
MTRLMLAVLFILSIGSALADPVVKVALPDYGTYSYWLQARNGSVISLPASVSDHQNITLRVPRQKGNRLVLLDAATGQCAQQMLIVRDDGTATPAVFTLGDFHPIAIPRTSWPAAASAPTVPNPFFGSLNPLVFAALLVPIAGAGWLLWTLGRRSVRSSTSSVAAQDVRDSSMISIPLNQGLKIVPLSSTRTEPASDTETQRGPTIPLARPATLVGVQGLATGSTFALTAGDVTIGRDGENEIVLAENTVSRYHARLLRQDNGQFALTDLGSANGVYVNGTRVQRAILRSGDEVKVGDNFFRFQSNDEAN